jgi:hypothetical protein
MTKLNKVKKISGDFKIYEKSQFWSFFTKYDRFINQLFYPLRT